jgi:hypothetical protein
MALLVLAYPRITQRDYKWIQAVRAESDEMYYEVVDPHFTIVFPVEGVDDDRFIEHVQRRAAGFSSFDFVLRCAVLANDAFKECTHVFLVPDEGHSDIVKLHDVLYTGPLAAELRLDIPFVPHVGIGNSADPQACKRLADELNRQDFEIAGTVDRLDVVRYETDTVETLVRVVLDGARPPTDG